LIRIRIRIEYDVSFKIRETLPLYSCRSIVIATEVLDISQIDRILYRIASIRNLFDGFIKLIYQVEEGLYRLHNQHF